MVTECQMESWCWWRGVPGGAALLIHHSCTVLQVAINAVCHKLVVVCTVTIGAHCHKSAWAHTVTSDHVRALSQVAMNAFYHRLVWVCTVTSQQESTLPYTYFTCVHCYKSSWMHCSQVGRGVHCHKSPHMHTVTRRHMYALSQIAMCAHCHNSPWMHSVTSWQECILS